MAFDGITVANIVYDLNNTILDGRISKIAQPEKDELLLTIKSKNGQFRLVLSASASLPLVYLSDSNKPSPVTAPNFCMLLRKHIANGRIISISQPEMERIINIEIEHLNDLGDLCHKNLIIEIMGKHSNIIFTNDQNMIIDSIKHIPANVSSVREVLPGREYFIPNTLNKYNPLNTNNEEFYNSVYNKPMVLSKALYSSYTGISPTIAEEICYRSGIDSDKNAKDLNDNEKLHFYNIFNIFMESIKNNEFSPCIVYEAKSPIEFGAISLTMYGDLTCATFNNISEVLQKYYSSKEKVSRIRQKSIDLRKITGTLLDREIKKYNLQLKQIEDTKDREKFKVYGELINTYGYSLRPGEKTLVAINYYNNKEVKIPIDSKISISENANKYFNKYNKQKRTFETLSELINKTKEEIEHLESICTALEIADNNDDLAEIKEELIQAGYIRRKKTDKKIKSKSKPYHFISSDGFHMYVGKNNFQNEYLTFKFATGNDWWFHAKGVPGSHVIVKTNGEELPDRTFEEAGKLAAYFSKGRENPKVEIDYIQKKHVKKANGGIPGFVIYHTNYSLNIEPDISNIKEVQ